MALWACGLPDVHVRKYSQSALNSPLRCLDVA